MASYLKKIFRFLFIVEPRKDIIETPIGVYPFYCKHCNFIWENRQDFLRHLDSEDSAKLAKLLNKVYYDSSKDVPKGRCEKIIRKGIMKGYPCLRKTHNKKLQLCEKHS